MVWLFHWCLYNKQNITCPLMDMNFICSCSTRYLTSERSERVRHCPLNQVWKIIKQILRSNLWISQFPSTSEGLVSKLNKLTQLAMRAVNKKRINEMELSTNSCTQETVTFVCKIAFSDSAWHRTLIFLCCFQSCDQQTYELWVQTLNGAPDAGFPRQSLNAKFSWWHKLAIDTDISCIHLYIWKYVWISEKTPE